MKRHRFYYHGIHFDVPEWMMWPVALILGAGILGGLGWFVVQWIEMSVP